MIIICSSKHSTRFPGKNKILWDYTRDWISYQLHHGHARAAVIGGTEPLDTQQLGCRYQELDPMSHHATLLTLATLEAYADELVCIVQITSPLREAWLLSAALELHEQTGKPVASVSTVLKNGGEQADGSLILCPLKELAAALQNYQKPSLPNFARLRHHDWLALDIDESRQCPPRELLNIAASFAHVIPQVC